MPAGDSDTAKLKNELKKARNTIVHLEHNNNILKQKLMQESARQLETQEIVDNSLRIQREFKMRLEQERRKIEEVEFAKRQETEFQLEETKRDLIAKDNQLKEIMAKLNDVQAEMNYNNEMNQFSTTGMSNLDRGLPRDEYEKHKMQLRLKDREYKKLRDDFSKQNDEFKKLLENNRILRSIAKVPENFGHEIDVNVLRANHQGSLEDYKALYNLVSKENEELKEHRENMSLKMKQLMVLYSNKSKDPRARFKNLTDEQLTKLDEYALNLMNGVESVPLTDKSKQLSAELMELQANYNALKNEQGDNMKIFTEKIQNTINEKEQYMPQQLDCSVYANNDRIEHLMKDQQQQMENDRQMFVEEIKVFMAENLQGFNNKLDLNIDESKKKIADLKNKNEEIQEHSHSMQASRAHSQMNDQGSQYNVGHKSHHHGSQRQNDQHQHVGNPSQQMVGYPESFKGPSLRQPEFGPGDHYTRAYSHRYDTELPLEVIDDGISEEMDLDRARFIIAQMQAHNMEMIETLNRREKDIKSANIELEEIKSKLNHILLVQDNLVANYCQEKKELVEAVKKFEGDSFREQSINMELGKKVQVLEETLASLDTKNRNTIEEKLSDFGKKLAMSESTLINIGRKYDALTNDYNLTEESYRKVQNNYASREKELIIRLNALKKWKVQSTETIKILLEKARSSHSHEDFRDVTEENLIMVESLSKLKIENALLKAKNDAKNSLDRYYQDELKKVKELENELNGINEENEVLSMRLQNTDGYYKKFVLIFKSIGDTLRRKKLNPRVVFEKFDKDNEGTISNQEFTASLEGLGIKISHDDQHNLFGFLDLNNDGAVDYKEFCRMLKRHGVTIRSKEEEIINTLWEAISKDGSNIEEFYDMMCPDFNKTGKGCRYEQMKNTFESLRLKVNESQLQEFFKLADLSDNGDISKWEFIQMFRKYNKQSLHQELGGDPKIDWKLVLMAKLHQELYDHGETLEEAFSKMCDSEGKANLERFIAFFQKFAVDFEISALKNLYNDIDCNRIGHINYDDFKIYISSATQAYKRHERAKILIENAKNLKPIEDDNQNMDQEMMEGIDNINKLQYKLAMVETRQKNKNNEIKILQKKIENSISEGCVMLEINKNQELDNERLQTQYMITRKEKVQIEASFYGGINKRDADELKKTCRKLTLDNADYFTTQQTYKHLNEASINEAKTLRQALARRDDEGEQLRKALKEIQAESDEKAMAGRLFHEVLTAKWNEGIANKKQEEVHDDLRNLKTENFDLANKLKNQTDELINVQGLFMGRLSVAEKSLQEAKQKILPTISQAKIDQLNKTISNIAFEKVQCEQSNRELAKENDNMGAEIDYWSTNKNVKEELEHILNEHSQNETFKKQGEMTLRYRDTKLEELRAKREQERIKAKESYYQKISNGLTDQIQQLENQVISADSKFNERDEFWKEKYGIQVDRVFGQSADVFMNVQDKQQKDQMLNNMLRKGIEGNKQELAEINKGIKLKEAMRTSGYMDGDLNCDSQNDMLKAKNQDLLQDIAKKEDLINKLQAASENRKQTIHYDSKQVDQKIMHDLENETREMAQAAQQTIMTLQQIIDEKQVEQDNRENKNAELRKDLSDKLQDLRTREWEIEKLKRKVTEMEKDKNIQDAQTSIKILDRVQRMDAKELEMMVVEYERKINGLTQSLASCEESNRELLHRLREQKLKVAKLENDQIKIENDEEIEKLKSDINGLTGALKKKNSELVNMKNMINDLKDELMKAGDERLLEEDDLRKKIISAENTNNHEDERRGEMRKKLEDMARKFKEKNKIIEKMKLQIKEMSETKEKDKVLKEQMTVTEDKQRKEINKLRDEVKSLGDKIKNTGSSTGFNSNSRVPNKNFRPDELSRKQYDYGVGIQEKKMTGQTLAESQMKKRIEMLQEENWHLKEKAQKGFFDTTGCIKPPQEKFNFESLDEYLNKIKDYLQTYNPHVKFYDLIRPADKKNTGKVPVNDLIIQLNSQGIKFQERHQVGEKSLTQFQLKDTSLVADKGYEHIDYLALHNRIHNQRNLELHHNPGGEPDSKISKVDTMKHDSFNKRPVNYLNDKKPKASETHLTEKNFETLRNKNKQLEKEIESLMRQCTSWKDQAKRLEQDLQMQANNMTRPGLSSMMNPQQIGGMNSSQMGMSLDMMKELEDKLTSQNFEKERMEKTRNAEIRDLASQLKDRDEEISYQISQNKMQSNKIDNIMSQNLTPNQLSEEWRSEKDHQISNLMVKLENSRDREKLMYDKNKGLEREVLELNYRSEESQNMIDKMNRKIRDLELTYTNKLQGAY